MRRTRFMSLVFLALSLAFFCVQEFRWALEYLVVEYKLGRLTSYAAFLPPEKVRALAERAQQGGDAQALAYAALHTENREESLRWADQAVAKDPQLTWIYYHVALNHMPFSAAPDPEVAKHIQEWIPKLQAFDPDNSVPYILQAQLIRGQAEKSAKWPYIVPSDPKSLEFPLTQPEWLAAMDHAFEKPRYDSYSVRRFELERRVLTQQGWATPRMVIPSLWFYPVPNLLHLRSYINFRVFYRGRRAEQAGRLEEALGHYYAVSAFGQRMRVGASGLLEELLGGIFDNVVSEPLQAALEKAGRKQEAAVVALRKADFERVWGKPREGKDPMRRSSNQVWSALQLGILGLLVWFFAALSLVSVLYVNAKRWIRPEKRGRLYQFITVLENYAPILLFVCCVGLSLLYAPYAQNFRYYMSVTGPIHYLEPISENVYPLFTEILWWGDMLPPENPFGNYIYWALGFLGLAVLLGAWGARQASRTNRR